MYNELESLHAQNIVVVGRYLIVASSCRIYFMNHTSILDIPYTEPSPLARMHEQKDLFLS